MNSSNVIGGLIIIAILAAAAAWQVAVYRDCRKSNGALTCLVLVTR